MPTLLLMYVVCLVIVDESYKILNPFLAAIYPLRQCPCQKTTTPILRYKCNNRFRGICGDNPSTPYN